MLLPGDPGRVPLIGSTWDAYDEVSFNREFRFGRGTVAGVPIGACSTGIGAPSAEIALIELAASQSDTFIRVGQENVLPLPMELPANGIAARMRSYGVATFEMEAAALFVLGSLLKRRCGSICSVESNRATGERRDVSHAIRNAVDAANRAVTILARWDERLRRTGRRHLSPSLLATQHD